MASSTVTDGIVGLTVPAFMVGELCPFAEVKIPASVEHRVDRLSPLLYSSPEYDLVTMRLNCMSAISLVEGADLVVFQKTYLDKLL